MKILNIIQRFPPAVGGSENFCEQISKHVSRKGYFVKILTTDIYNIDEFQLRLPADKFQFKFSGVEYRGNMIIRRCKITKVFSFFRRLFNRKIFKNSILYVISLSPVSLEMFFGMFGEIKDCDIVHLNTLPYFHVVLGFYLAKILRKKIVITPFFHPGHEHYEMKIFYKLMRKCDAVLTLSDYESEYLIKKGIRREQIFNIGAGIYPQLYKDRENDVSYKANLIKRYKVKDNSKIILFIGGKLISKGVEFLISAVEKLIDEKQDVFLFMVGPNTWEFDNIFSKLKRKYKERIIDLGIVSESDKVSLLSLSNLLVLPSAFESFGIVFLEAWICGKPVIGTEKGAIPSIIENAGLISKFGDSLDLKNKIQQLINDDNLSKKLGENGRRKVLEKYNWEEVGNKVIKVYNTINDKYKKRLLIVSHFFPPDFVGGSELVAFEQAKAMKKMGYEIKVFCGRLVHDSQRFRVRHENGFFKMTRFNLSYKDFDHKKYANCIKNELESIFKDELLKFAPDLVHFHNLFPLSASLVDVCKDLNIPNIITLHDYWGICAKNTMVCNNDAICDKNGLKCLDCQDKLSFDSKRDIILPVRNFLIKQSFSKIDRFISPSRYLADAYIASGFPKDKFSVINNGIDVNRFKSIHRSKSRKIRFGFVGNLVGHKGVDYLLFAIANLSDKDKERISCYLVGGYKCVFFDYCKYIVKKLKLEKIVSFIAKVDNHQIHKIYSMIDVLVLPSLWPENSPVSIMEAMASKIPILATNIGGIKELVIHGKNGLLFECGDYMDLKRNIEKLINNPAEIKRMGEEGFNMVQAYQLKNQVRLIDNEYKKLINSKAQDDRKINFIMYKGEFNNLHTQNLFRHLKKYESELGRPINLCHSDFAQDGFFKNAKAFLITHYTCTQDLKNHITQAAQYGIKTFLNSSDKRLGIFLSDNIYQLEYYNDDYSEFKKILGSVYE